MTKRTERFTEVECIEVIAHCALIEQSIKELREKALDDLHFRLNQPKLTVIDGSKDD
jgi:hypothetical protein